MTSSTTCRLCGQVGESSNDPLITLTIREGCDFGHVFHQNCVPDGKCPICTQNQKCAICLHDINDSSIDALEGCIHRFHPNCIIPYFRRGYQNCPVCRHNPYEQDDTNRSDSYVSDSTDEDEYPLDTQTWSALKKIRTLQLNKASRSKDTRVQDEVESINSRLEIARKEIKRIRRQKERQREKRKEKMKSPEFLQLYEDLNKAKETRRRVGKELVTTRRTWRKAGAEIRKLSNSIRRVKYPRRFIRSKRKPNLQRIISKKSILGSKINPEYQYLMDDGSWSRKKNSGELRDLYENGDITRETLIRHPLLIKQFPEGVAYGYLKDALDRHFI